MYPVRTHLRALGPGPEAPTRYATATPAESNAAPPPAICATPVSRWRFESDVPAPPAGAREVVYVARATREETVVDDEGTPVEPGEGAHAPAVYEAIRRALRGRGMTVLAASDVAGAESLVRERRLRAGGPTCRAAPSLDAVLAARFPRLVRAAVSPTCTRTDAGETRCSLRVTFDLQGVDDAPGRNPMRAELAGTAQSPAAWARAARSLRDEQPLAGLLGTLGHGGSGRYELHGIESHPATLPLFDTFSSGPVAAQLAACHRGPDVRAYHLHFTVAADGTVVNPGAELFANGALSETDPGATCMRDALVALGFSCRPDGAPARVELDLCLAGGQAARGSARGP